MLATITEKLVAAFKVTSSMSRKGDCWDNAVTETLFGSLKVERLHGMRFDMRRLAKDEVMDRLLQPSTASFNAGLYQSDGLQTEMACPGN
jgi:putative transposase